MCGFDSHTLPPFCFQLVRVSCEGGPTHLLDQDRSASLQEILLKPAAHSPIRVFCAAMSVVAPQVHAALPAPRESQPRARKEISSAAFPCAHTSLLCKTRC